jgi:hypothetical protein
MSATTLAVIVGALAAPRVDALTGRRRPSASRRRASPADNLTNPGKVALGGCCSGTRSCRATATSRARPATPTFAYADGRALSVGVAGDGLRARAGARGGGAPSRRATR